MMTVMTRMSTMIMIMVVISMIVVCLITTAMLIDLLSGDTPNWCKRKDRGRHGMGGFCRTKLRVVSRRSDPRAEDNNIIE